MPRASYLLLFVALMVVPPTALGETTMLRASQGVVDEGAACCKMCRNGKACGDGCIARGDTCHKPPGCACDAR